MFPIGDDNASRGIILLVTFTPIALNVIIFFVGLCGDYGAGSGRAVDSVADRFRRRFIRANRRASGMAYMAHSGVFVAGFILTHSPRGRGDQTRRNDADRYKLRSNQ